MDDDDDDDDGGGELSPLGQAVLATVIGGVVLMVISAVLEQARGTPGGGSR